MREHEIPISTGRSRTNVDEMSIDFIKSQFAWISSTPWADTNSAGSLLLTMATGIGNSDTKTYGKGATAAPVDYLSYLFQQWRGSIKYKFLLPKTEFHSGRLVVAWQSIDNSTTLHHPVNLNDTDNLIRVVWDIRESNEMEFIVPYVQTKNFLDVNTPSGYLYIYVLNELIAPSTVNSSINILMEKAGGDDLEYALPIHLTATSTEYKEPYVSYQSAPSISLGKTSSPLILTAESVGEACRSLRAYLKRPHLWFIESTTATAYSVDLYPFENAVTTQATSNAGALVRTSARADPMSFISVLYAISSGSVRLVATIHNSSTLQYWTIGSATGTPYNSVNIGLNTPGGLAPIAIIPPGIEGLSIVEIPQYLLEGARAVGNRLVGTQATLGDAASSVRGGANLFARLTTVAAWNFASTPLQVYRAAADDFNLSVWNGTFPYVSNEAT